MSRSRADVQDPASRGFEKRTERRGDIFGEVFPYCKPEFGEGKVAVCGEVGEEQLGRGDCRLNEDFKLRSILR